MALIKCPECEKENGDLYEKQKNLVYNNLCLFDYYIAIRLFFKKQ